MARIRSIKPEFPHSESMGRVSRDARLTFIELWTLADDAGRLRGNSRMLASLLFPYDDDAKDLIDGWLGELESEGCVARYQISGTSYLQICNWLDHQKIDKPSPSKLPEMTEDSRIVATTREDSRSVVVGSGSGSGSGSGWEGSGEEGKGSSLSAAPTARADVQFVFAHWQTEHGHPNAKLDHKRKRRIVDGLKSFTPEQLCNAITGYSHSPHHMGTDPRGNGVKYDDIELFLRDATHIETGLRLFAHPPRPPPKPENLSPGERVRRAYQDNGNGSSRVVAEQFGSGDGDVGDVGGRVWPALPS